MNIGSKLAHDCPKLRTFSPKKKSVIRSCNITYNIAISIHIRAKSLSLIDLALTIILSLYTALDLT